MCDNLLNAYLSTAHTHRAYLEEMDLYFQPKQIYRNDDHKRLLFYFSKKVLFCFQSIFLLTSSS